MSGDLFDDSLSFLNEVEEPKATPKRKSAESFNTGLEQVSATQAARATGSKSMAGQYKRFTLYLRPEDIEEFKRISGKIGLSQAETGRWFFQHMFKLFEQGTRPETEEVVVKRRLKR